jgi:hypothetical protein
MRRLLSAAALFSAVASVMPAAGALAQTVTDYEAALEAAPIADTPAQTDAAFCRALYNYVFTSIPEDLRVNIALPLYSIEGSTSAEVERKRTICEEARRQSVIRFNAGTGEEIVTPPLLNENPGRANNGVNQN